MKIAILTTYFDPEENGLTRYINGLYLALIEKHPEIRIEIITFDTLKTKKYNQKTKNWVIRRIDCMPILGRTYAIPTLKGLKQLKKIFNKNSYNLINTHTRFFLSSYLGVKYGKKYGIPVLHTEHGSGFVKHQNQIVELIAKLYDLTLGKYVFKNATKVCGVSRSACQFAEKLGAGKTEVIYNGIDLSFWKEKINENRLKEELHIKKDEVVFCFVGRLIPEKGCQDLIKVLCEVKSINWKLLVIGDGFYKKELEKMVNKLNIKEKVIFLGQKNEKDVRNIIRISDLVINPSYASEGGPRTIIEAGACGCPILSSDNGLAIEILKKDSLYSSRNLEELKNKILSYKQIPIPDVAKFDWENISKKYYKLISSF